LAPRALEDSVRTRRPSGVVVRPLNFTVRGRAVWLTQYLTPSFMPKWLLTAATVLLALPFGWGMGLLAAYLIAGKNFGQLPAATVSLGIIVAMIFAFWSSVKLSTRFTVMLVGTVAFILFAWLIA
jgi:hypothetical protein